LKPKLEIFNKKNPTKAAENRDTTFITVTTLPEEKGVAKKNEPKKKKVCNKGKSKRKGSRSIYSFTGIPFFFEDVEQNRPNQAQTTTSVRNDEIVKDSKSSQDDINSIETYIPDTESPFH